MTTKYLTGAYPGGYTLSAAYTGLDIESGASIGGAGVVASSFPTVRNDGVVQATTSGANGVSLATGGVLQNGSAADTVALIEGYRGVDVGGSQNSSVSNFGSIIGLMTRGGFGVYGHHGNITNVINGSAKDDKALIEGFYSVDVGDNSTIKNFGTMYGLEESVSQYADSGQLINGSNNDTAATIESAGYKDFGGTGIKTGTSVHNYGTILAPTFGIYVIHDGVAYPTIVNGSDNDTKAFIYGGYCGIKGHFRVTNFGTISGSIDSGNESGVVITSGGAVTNGSENDHEALISGYWGILCGGESISVSNFGTILGTARPGVNRHAAGIIAFTNVTSLVVTNGSQTDTAALIDGYFGFDDAGAAVLTVTNFGTIDGTGGVAVHFKSTHDTLQVEAGSTFLGAVLGAGGTLDLASGIGTISGLTGGNVTVSGSMTTTTFTDFGTLEIADGARFTSRGAGVIGPEGTESLVDDGALVVDGRITGTGTLTVGAGTLTIHAGASVKLSSATFGPGAIVNGAGTVTLANATVAGLAVGASALLTDGNLFDQTGNILLRRNAKAARAIVDKGAVWRLDGDVGMARRMSGNPMIMVEGTFVKSAGSGVSAVGVYVEVDGLAEAATGTLDFQAGVTGSGTLQVDAAATLECDRAVDAGLSASFAGSGATLALKDPSAFAATIGGFASGDAIDLLDVAATSAVLGAGDTLVITNGSATVATLQLTGDYTGATFSTASDGKGGTNITVSTPPGAEPPATSRTTLHPFIAAAASFGATGGGAAHFTAQAHAERPLSPLAAPRIQTA